MQNFGKVRSTNEPQPIQFTSSSVFLASNITPYEETIDEHTIQGYEYDLIQYTKDEYLLILAQKNNELIEELQAAKILLGVE